MDDVNSELEALRGRKVVLGEKIRKAELELGRLRSDMSGLDRAIGLRLERLFGIKIDVSASQAPSVVAAAHEPPPAPTTPSRPPSALDAWDVIEASQGDPDQTDAAAEEEAWARLLRNPRTRHKWREVHMVRRAIARLGNRAKMVRILEAVHAEDPHYTYKRLEALLYRDSHFKSDGSRRWFYIPGAPMFTPKEKEVFEKYRAVADAITELKEDATLTTVLAWIQRRYNPAFITSSNTSRYLTSGPFKKNPRGFWEISPDVDLRPMKLAARPMKTRRSLVTVDGEFPLDLPREDWSRRIWTVPQRHQWELVLKVRSVIEREGGKATVEAITWGVGAWKRKKGAPQLRNLLRMDPHFHVNADGTYSFVDGPPHVTDSMVPTWELREAVRASVVGRGGSCLSKEIAEDLANRVPPMEVTTSSIAYVLNRGPYWRQEDGRWLHRPDQEPPLPTGEDSD